MGSEESIKMYPLSLVSPDDTRMELGCGSTRMVLTYCEDLFGRRTAEELAYSTKMNFDYIYNRNNWVSFSYYCRLLDALVARTGNKKAPYDAGVLSSEKGCYGSIELLVARLSSVKSIFRLVVLSSPLWDKLSDWKLIEVKRNRCVLRIKNRVYSQNKNNCLSIQGVMAALPKLHGFPPADIRELKCACDGADACEYEIVWLAMPLYVWSWLFGALGLVGAAFIYQTHDYYLSIAVAILGITCGRLLDSRRQLRKVYRSNEAQAESLQQSMQDVEKLNEELQGKVEVRTEELKIANVSLEDALLEQQRSEVKALRAERQAAVGVLAAGMAHEINNPVNAIRLSLQTLLRKVDESNPMHPLLDNASIATSRCTRIVNDLLTFARNEQNLTQVDLKNVLERSVDIFQKEDARGVEVELDIDEAVPMVQVDAQQMQQAILNLMTNAGDAMKGKGKIDISLAREGDDVVLRHQDYGPGIDESMKARIFDPFFSTKKGGSSKGLGLSITVALVGRNNGKIDVESEDGKGACFVLRFPAENIEKGPM